jgi:hypothetical protein
VLIEKRVMEVDKEFIQKLPVVHHSKKEQEDQDITSMIEIIILDQLPNGGILVGRKIVEIFLGKYNICLAYWIDNSHSKYKPMKMDVPKK